VSNIWGSYQFALKLFKDQDKIFSTKGINFLSDGSLSILKLYALLYKVLNSCDKELEVISTFTQFSNIEKIEGYQFIRCIFNFVSYYNKINRIDIPYIPYILQIILNKSYDEYYRTRCYAVNCLGILCKSPFKNIAIFRLSEMMEDLDYRVRLRVLNQINVIKEIDEQFYNHILQKAKVDNNYLIRSFK